ncbi:hypothetical protein, partial [Nitrosomonas sp.]|uniref:hypothetical protein n=1 Tax=Nitrosomonas sp. TaxID=42353 RepID=UPI0035B233DB
MLVLLYLWPGDAYSKSQSSAFKAIEAARAATVRGKMDETQRQAAMDHLDAAQADEREAGILQESLVKLRAETADQPARMERLNKDLAVNRERELLEWSRR